MIKQLADTTLYTDACTGTSYTDAATPTVNANPAEKQPASLSVKSSSIKKTLSPIKEEYLRFIEALKSEGFQGDLNPDYANRVVLSTDNSIYQLLPQAVLYPKHQADLELIARLSNQPGFEQITLSPRGGGTGTNGQSLTDGLVVDISKHMNQILEINVEERWVRVQTGVVKDQLNKALKEHGLFFAPELSTSNRATLGGMINTDASGQGSVLYGKTRDHVLELTSVLLDGTLWHSQPISDEQLAQIKQRDDRVGDVHRLADQIFSEQAALIEAKFPKLNRCLTGYDLAHIRDENGQFNLNALLCGAEGSLAFISEAKLNVLPIPKYSALVNIQYTSFNDALRDAKELTLWNPTSIETVDSKVLNLAMGDIVWDTVQDYFPAGQGDKSIAGINLVEYTGDDEAELNAKVNKLTAHLDEIAQSPLAGKGKSFAYTIARGAGEIGKIWGMRKKAVGLLGNADGEKRPIPFVEDTAVPPENLADYIMEFRELLDSHDLAYGMFGHVDAGVLHVRPAIDMKDPEQEPLIRTITDAVVALTQKYKGLVWGEHGKGVRSEYAPEFFGELYPFIQEVKAVFDPRNQLNPGKIATPAQSGAELLKIDGVATRGQHDRQITEATRHEFSAAMYCNGNGACYNYDLNDAMCPSWKATRERTQSPKGRASLIREWLRLQEAAGADLQKEAQNVRGSNFVGSFIPRLKNTLAKRKGGVENQDYSHEVYQAMAGCLACKSCVGQCPIKVNVPEFRSKFLELYHGRYLRPLKDYFVGTLEYIIPYAAKVPSLYNLPMKVGFVKALMAKYAGMVDSPLICKENIAKELARYGVAWASPEALARLPAEQKDKTVVLVQDAFTSFFETRLVLDIMDLLTRLGFRVFIAPFKPNGKPLHVHGMMNQFGRAAADNSEMLRALSETGVPLVGIDPSMTLTYRQEYTKALPEGDAPDVLLLQEWLVSQIATLETHGQHDQQEASQEVFLLAHCTEKTNAAATIKMWQQVYAALGFKLTLQASGCCGMSGTFGHETANLDTSKTIYSQSWSGIINDTEKQGRLVATGYSCRSQVKRLDDQHVPHPLQWLLRVLNNQNA
ncbi:D-2-hydroxyglutarate dehydrogenase YdiJ [Oceanospirillum maris]|uniref:D-2-hydroxyglutarate dehydrogenase YdiJ n=1 Tax=Oceanospirillum maris TaxID=64977 RepID=UPI0004006C29|nr:FAD-binding and (Fe-S)-binding domain-containing protein [Oceanospirillum maris]